MHGEVDVVVLDLLRLHQKEKRKNANTMTLTSYPEAFSAPFLL
jgi:hypothetical protein